MTRTRFRCGDERLDLLEVSTGRYQLVLRSGDEVSISKVMERTRQEITDGLVGNGWELIEETEVKQNETSAQWAQCFDWSVKVVHRMPDGDAFTADQLPRMKR